MLAAALYVFGLWVVSSGVVETSCFDLGARTFVVSYYRPADCVCRRAHHPKGTIRPGWSGREHRASDRGRHFLIDDITNVRVERRGHFSHAADSRHYCVVVSVHDSRAPSPGADAHDGGGGGGGGGSPGGFSSAVTGDAQAGGPPTAVEILQTKFLRSASENCVRIQHFLNCAGVSWGDAADGGGANDSERLVIDEDDEGAADELSRNETRTVELTALRRGNTDSDGKAGGDGLVVSI